MSIDRTSFPCVEPGLPRRGRVLASLIDPVVLRGEYEAGDSTVDLSRRYGVSRVTIRKILIKAGATTRDVAAARRVRPANAFLTLDKPQPVRGHPEVEDVFGILHKVTSITPTTLGWDILRGFPFGAPTTPGVILTREVVDHLELFRLRPGRHQLPLSEATILRLRRRLSFEWRSENRAWWAAHREVVKKDDIVAFAAEHGVTIPTARRHLSTESPFAGPPPEPVYLASWPVSRSGRRGRGRL